MFYSLTRLMQRPFLHECHSSALVSLQLDAAAQRTEAVTAPADSVLVL